MANTEVAQVALNDGRKLKLDILWRVLVLSLSNHCGGHCCLAKGTLTSLNRTRARDALASVVPFRRWRCIRMVEPADDRIFIADFR